MMTYAFLALSLASVGIAWDKDFPLYCGEQHDQFCIQPLSDSCYACINPVEASCPGDEGGPGFKDCFCPVPSKTMDAITACINDPNTRCDVENGVLGTFNLECQDYNKGMCAVYDATTKKVTLQPCDGSPVSTIVRPSTSAAPASSSAASSVVSASSAVVSSSSAPVTSKGPSSATGAASHSGSQPASTSVPVVVPPTGGANALAAGGNVVALLAGVAALAL
ncbi:hypothetical protein VHEMI06851 [[Torrubiella] hemipterigena]|uniref:Extracellular membrane protein CFEM domain-containing protein n=1 Tax=[Torrubiella] hemipterigena TaxID=1531966 RepID=A0A0A1TK42_9HYPO|nr:hypothetical protein VHEMI06851 [[Torrubiella] hemipterigena]